MKNMTNPLTLSKTFLLLRNLKCSKLEQPIKSNFQFLRENHKIKTSLKFRRTPCKTPKFIWEKLASKLDVFLEICHGCPWNSDYRHSVMIKNIHSSLCYAAFPSLGFLVCRRALIIVPILNSCVIFKWVSIQKLCGIAPGILQMPQKCALNKISTRPVFKTTNTTGNFWSPGCHWIFFLIL